MVKGYDLDGIGMTSARSRARLVDQLERSGIVHQGVLEAFAAVPRHIFVEEAIAHRAYQDEALPIGHGQSISRPFTVAAMTAALLETPKDSVLEVGTGSGFQTALLAQLCGQVFTVERIKPLLDQARRRFEALKTHNVSSKLGDGYNGWAEQGPFSGILVTAAPRAVPQMLLEQLDIGGRMVVPVGGDGDQRLKVIDRTEQGYGEREAPGVRFVPLVKGLRT
ncbi:MAG: protein-L-isoaspartate(D-aspartate) O-methyltransferase [Gammaproteobacteria bacterium]|nr:protein-L-isoaspartate(D-aspartate) O-methyltransferase [Gammaproteobacteria bacterium]MYE85785.1 protein-L-isoaspartate(D-aspartate) O-methyltransferase [Gammaproteobacteria bacterium]MYG14009.1 protein-L-isoaspartate(D-aspartate) O-methyltransferase [Gammaproteobacteria bacterium]MYH14691.1 protein-L-isoaspartate(D-aspartate) O-methyltransferase [Gammaproteobacteria bacterium]MYK29626.1 protein-L-isoaspartate(D-aspartate) O-methyltransferase [Gammaproteobacteria bacterium]